MKQQMQSVCTSPYPYVGIAGAIVIALCLSLILGQQLQILRKQSPGFDQQRERVLLVMLAAALLEIGLFVVYVLSGKIGC